MIRTQLPTQRRIDPWLVIESPPDTPDCSAASQTRKRHVDRATASDIEEILGGEGSSFAKSINPRNYLISHGLHNDNVLGYLEKIYYFF